MAEISGRGAPATTARSLPLTACTRSGLSCAAAELAALGPAWRVSLRCRGDRLPTATKPLGFELPVIPMRAASAGKVAALWLGPDEWMIVADEVHGAALAGPLAAAIAAAGGSVVDISHRHAALTVQGPLAADVLNAHVALDLAPAAFPVGMCTRTLLAKAEIVLWRTAADTFRIETGRTLARYVWELLEDARREHTDT